MNLLQPIYIKKVYRYTLIYCTPIYQYIDRIISIFPMYHYIVAIPIDKTVSLSVT